MKLRKVTILDSACDGVIARRPFGMSETWIVLFVERIEQECSGLRAGGIGLGCEYHCRGKRAQPFHHIAATLPFGASVILVVQAPGLEFTSLFVRHLYSISQINSTKIAVAGPTAFEVPLLSHYR